MSPRLVYPGPFNNAVDLPLLTDGQTGGQPLRRATAYGPRRRQEPPLASSPCRRSIPRSEAAGAPARGRGRRPSRSGLKQTAPRPPAATGRLVMRATPEAGRSGAAPGLRDPTHVSRWRGHDGGGARAEPRQRRLGPPPAMNGAPSAAAFPAAPREAPRSPAPGNSRRPSIPWGMDACRERHREHTPYSSIHPERGPISR